MPVTCTCIVCGTKFNVKPSKKDTAKFCSRECQYEYMKHRTGEWIIKICPSCGEPFEILKSKNKKYCSEKCNKERNEKYMFYNCDGCGEEMRIKKSLYQELLDGKRKSITCSYECMGKVKRTGHDIICDNCGKPFYRRQYHIDRQANNQQNNFCSVECEMEYKYKETHETRRCEICGIEFECYKKSTQRFCSPECNSEWQKTLTGENNSKFNRKEIECDYCHDKFYEKAYKLQKYNHHFCSVECRQRWYSEIWSQREELKERSRKTMLRELESGEISKTNSFPQQLIDNALKDLNINFEREKNMKYYCIDNYLTDYNLAIEVMGDYWHSNPIRFNSKLTRAQYNRISKDKAKHTYMKNYYNIEILYLWESDIIKNIDLCKNLILKYIKENGILDNYNSFNYIIDNNELKLSSNIIIPYQDMNISEYKHLYKDN